MSSFTEKIVYCPTCEKSVPSILGVDFLFHTKYKEENRLFSVCAISKYEQVNKKLAENCDYNEKER